MIETRYKNSRIVSLREICQRLGLVISQRYETADIMERCELVGLPFKATQLVLIENGMLTNLVYHNSELPF